MLIHHIIDTPDGPFTVLERDQVVVASAWNREPGLLAARVGSDASVPGHCQATHAVLAYYAGDLRAPATVRIAPAGTEFRTRVWQHLREIPPGESRTYAQVAAAVGSPGASRAVGSACGANPVALFIPCHRVSGADGKLTGFAWGVDIKRSLLERESQKPVTDARDRAGADNHHAHHAVMPH